jgi:endonuclease YncB( thermonuclease family)
MRRIVVAALVFLLLAAPAASADTLTGRVVKVADGDTVTVLDHANTQYRIRLQGIDAPERRQAYGNASRKHLASLVAGKTVTVEWDKRDRYGRIVGKVLVGDVDVCLEQVRAGYAWHFKRYQHEQSPEDRQLYAQAEEKARADRLALWQDKHPVPPWKWRRMNRQSAAGHFVATRRQLSGYA